MTNTHPYALREETIDMALTEPQHDALIAARIVYDIGDGNCRLTAAMLEHHRSAEQAIAYVEGYLDAIKPAASDIDDIDAEFRELDGMGNPLDGSGMEAQK